MMLVRDNRLQIHSWHWLLLVLASFVLRPLTAEPPATPKQPVVDRYPHGAEITDPFRWLEAIETEPVQDWVEAQNKHANQHLADLAALPALRKRVTALLADVPPTFSRIQVANRVVCAQLDGQLVLLESVQNPKPLQVLVDPLTFLPGRRVEIDFAMLSGNGKFVAACVSAEGLEDGTIHVFETATGKKLPDVIPQASGPPGGDLAWDLDDAGFFYTHYPFAVPGGKPTSRRYACQEIRYHKLGDPADQDHHVCGEQFPRFPQCLIISCWESKHLLFSVEQGDHGSGCAFFLRTPSGEVKRCIRPDDGVVDAAFFSKNELVVHSVKDAPRGQLLVCPLDGTTVKKGTVLIPQNDGILSSWTVTENYLWVTDHKDGRERVRIFDRKGQLAPASGRIQLPPWTCLCANSFTALGGDEVLYRVEGFLHPPRWYRFHPLMETPRPVEGMTGQWKVNFDDVEVVRESARAGDGTLIPMTILRPKKCPLDGKRPVLIEVYGGSKIRDEPSFSAERRLWFDQGGVLVIAHPRGSGDHDEEAFRATLNGNKQVTAEDVVTCAEHLIARKYTNPTKLAITGGSFGGFVVGMVVTQRPDLFAAAITDGGVFDILRRDHQPFGAHLAFEYGRRNDQEQFQRIRASSPYDRPIQKGGQYPALWLRVGGNDRRVMPWHSWKLAAKLQAAGSKKPVLVSTRPKSGHDTWWPIEEDYAFLFAHLGVEYIALPE